MTATATYQIVESDRFSGDVADPTALWEHIVVVATRARASDIHLTAQKDRYELALRIDGDLHFQAATSTRAGRHIISHVKSLAGMDIAERRRPTEGRLKETLDGRVIDLRISTVPSLHGQDLCCRLFDHTIALRELEELGLLENQLDQIRDLTSRPNGLILVSGPTGGGKTTTLYSMLMQLAGGNRKIVTIEDPVEYDLPGVNQIQVHQRIGVTYASMLTAVLRQDADVIMVGEIRDPETAATAVRAANTGHLVLATTHASKASRAIESMLSLGVHPYFLAVSLRGVIAQLLAKRICPHCRTALPETTDFFMDSTVRAHLAPGEVALLHQGTGCEHCRHLGYSDRMGLFEVFTPGESGRQLVLDRRPATEIDALMTTEGTLTLEQAGKLAAVRGQTTVEELVRVLPTL